MNHRRPEEYSREGLIEKVNGGHMTAFGENVIQEKAGFRGHHAEKITLQEVRKTSEDV